MAKATYKDAGVDLDIYRESMARLPSLMHRTFSPRVMRLDGGFAGLFQLDFHSPLFRRTYDDPVLVSCTDGVGTKLKIAMQSQTHHTVGIDLVAMSVNDAICCGAEPLFFLDYVAMSHDDPDTLEKIVRGISDGCVQADCALLGGETAIMPDLYTRGEYDLAGFCVGVVERKHLITGRAIDVGDRVLAISSSGLHSNGYSLARRIVFDIAKLTLEANEPRSGLSVKDLLLEPTRIYARALKRVLNHYKVKSVVHGVAHITGGGLQENLQRIVPSHVDVQIDPTGWPVPPVFTWLQELGDVDMEEMRRVFNMGVGLTLVVSAFYANRIRQLLEASGYDCFEIGHVTPGTGQVHLAN